MDQWQKIFDTRKHHEAEIVKTLLIDNDIQAVIVDKQDSLYQFGYYEVHVPVDDVLQAIKIIKEGGSFS